MKISMNEDSGHAKMLLSRLIVDIIGKKGWNQAAAARVLDVDQPKISQLKSERVSGFSLERLIRFLIRMDCKVSCVVDLPRDVNEVEK